MVYGSEGRMMATVIMRSGLMYGSEILREPTAAQFQHLERAWANAARFITGASQTCSHDVMLGELGWLRIADYHVIAKFNFFHRLRIGGNRVGLAAWMWRVRMGDAWSRIFGRNNASTATIAHLNRGVNPVSRSQRRRHAHPSGWFASLNNHGTTQSIAAADRADSDGDNSSDDDTAINNTRVRCDSGDMKRASLSSHKRSTALPDAAYTPRTPATVINNITSSDTAATESTVKQRQHRLPTAFCESIFYLFMRYGDNDEWWQTRPSSSMPLDIWSADRYDTMMSLFAKQWSHRVQQQRRGREIYTRVQPSWPHYFVRRRLSRGSRGRDAEHHLAMVYNDDAHAMIDDDRGMMMYDTYPSHHDGNGDDDRMTIPVRKEGVDIYVKKRVVAYID